jgi:hypothetical protein
MTSGNDAFSVSSQWWRRCMTLSVLFNGAVIGKLLAAVEDGAMVE